MNGSPNSVRCVYKRDITANYHKNVLLYLSQQPLKSQDQPTQEGGTIEQGRNGGTCQVADYKNYNLVLVIFIYLPWFHVAMEGQLHHPQIRWILLTIGGHSNAYGDMRVAWENLKEKGDVRILECKGSKVKEGPFLKKSVVPACGCRSKIFIRDQIAYEALLVIYFNKKPSLPKPSFSRAFMVNPTGGQPPLEAIQPTITPNTVPTNLSFANTSKPKPISTPKLSNDFEKVLNIYPSEKSQFKVLSSRYAMTMKESTNHIR
ncbi:hypothetical protein RND71_019281 [Anisodus tanguticus]|uniref:Uncharacterized protein n=1 Tax=Anisodus tanguticus TaxID=243964 RepID=A0AAE1RX60_9SOLA|nr:hypothetical protein RND71_019281 [Anisodus tanguticus]